KFVIGDDSDTDRIRGQRDEPHPVALTHQMVGRQTTKVAVGYALLPVRLVRPFGDVYRAVDAKPHRVHVVAVRFLQPQLALKDRSPAGGIYHPPCPDVAPLSARPGHADVVPFAVRSERDRTHPGAAPDSHVARDELVGQVVLEPPPVDLVGGTSRRTVRVTEF